MIMTTVIMTIMNMTTITIINFIQAPRSGVCPLLCSGQGDYINGECVCKPGWKGKECNIRFQNYN